MLPRALMASPRPAASRLSLAALLMRNTLTIIRNALEEHCAAQTENFDMNEVYAAVLAPLYNLNDRPGILFEVLRTHSGEMRSEDPLQRCSESAAFIPVNRQLY